MVLVVGGNEEEALRGHEDPLRPRNYSSWRGAMTPRLSACWSWRESLREIKFPPLIPSASVSRGLPAGSSTPSQSNESSLRIHGSSLRCTQLRPCLLLPLNRRRKTRDPRPGRLRNLPLRTIHERGGLGTGEVTGKHCYRDQPRRVCCWYLLRPKVWGFDHTLEGTRALGLPCFPHSFSST
jgi:hypothetical protein